MIPARDIQLQWELQALRAEFRAGERRATKRIVKILEAECQEGDRKTRVPLKVRIQMICEGLRFSHGLGDSPGTNGKRKAR
jgi:hypothetical protein